jgi:hypothetical protein
MIGGNIPTRGVILLPMIGYRGMIPGGDIIGSHVINITLDCFSLSKGERFIKCMERIP